MIRSFFITIFGFLFIASPLCQGSLAAENDSHESHDSQVIDGIAAVVNGNIITYSQVRNVVSPRERLLRSQFTGQELVAKIKEARSAALQDLIDRELIVQAFRKEKFEIPQFFVDERVDEVIRDNFGGDRNAFVKTLQAQNFTLSEFKKDEMDKIIVSAMRGKNVKPNTVVAPSRIEQYWAQHRAEFTTKEEVKLRMIMIPSHEADGNGASQKAMAEEILGKLVAGSAFDRMAQMYSEDSTKDLGGDWGWIGRKTLAPELEKVAFNLKPGKISNIIALGGNYYILKVEERRGGENPGLAKVRPEIEKRLLQEESQRLQEVWIAGLRQKAYIRTF